MIQTGPGQAPARDRTTAARLMMKARPGYLDM